MKWGKWDEYSNSRVSPDAGSRALDGTFPPREGDRRALKEGVGMLEPRPHHEWTWLFIEWIFALWMVLYILIALHHAGVF